MKRFLAAILSLTLVLTALCAVAVSADETYPKEGAVAVYYEDFESYDTSKGSIKLPNNSWSGSRDDVFSYEICNENGNNMLRTSNWNASAVLVRYFDALKWVKDNPNKNTEQQRFAQAGVFVRFTKSNAFEAKINTDYTNMCDFIYKQGDEAATDKNAYMSTVSANKAIWKTESSEESAAEIYPAATMVKNDNGWYTVSSKINIFAFGTDKTGTTANITLGHQLGNWGATVYTIVDNIMKKPAYSALTSSDTSSDTYKAAVAEIQAELDSKDYRTYVDNVKVTAPATIYQDTVVFSGGSAVVTAKTDATGDGVPLRSGDKVEVNDVFGTVYTITTPNGVVGRVKYNGLPVSFKQSGNTVTVTIPAASITGNGKLEIIVAENSEYVTNTYTANFKGGAAVNDVANPSLTSTDGRITLQVVNQTTGNEANIADSAAGTFSYNTTAKNHRMGVVFNTDAENPLYYASGRTYGWKLFHTGTYSPGYLQWSNPWNGSYYSLQNGEKTSNNRVNASVNGPSGNAAKGSNYVYNSNDNGLGYVGFFAKLDGKNNITDTDAYGCSVPGNIEILPGSKGVFTGFEYSETVMMHKISFDGEGTLKVSAPSLNNFDANKCDATLTSGQSAKVEDLMKVDFTVTAPANKVVETIKYITYDGETEIGAELAGTSGGSFSVQPVDASGTVKVTYADSTPTEPKIEYSSANVEKNKTYMADGVVKTSANSIVMYGTVTGEFDAYGFILSYFGEESVKKGEVTLKAETKSADGRFAIRVVGDAITLGKYTAAPYGVKTGSSETDKGTETDITVE